MPSLVSRNPLKSGQCFLLKPLGKVSFKPNVAIPSNRVNVSYKMKVKRKLLLMRRSQSPQIGSMFLTLVYLWIEDRKSVV